MEYRQLFVKCELEEHSTILVTNDMYFVDRIFLNHEELKDITQEEFDKICQDYLNTERFQSKLQEQRTNYRKAMGYE